MLLNSTGLEPSIPFIDLFLSLLFDFLFFVLPLNFLYNLLKFVVSSAMASSISHSGSTSTFVIEALSISLVVLFLYGRKF